MSGTIEQAVRMLLTDELIEERLRPHIQTGVVRWDRIAVDAEMFSDGERCLVEAAWQIWSGSGHSLIEPERPAPTAWRMLTQMDSARRARLLGALCLVASVEPAQPPEMAE